MKAIILLLAVFITGCGGRLNSKKQADNKEKHYIIIMGGQSNMVGQGQISELDNPELPENITYFNFSNYGPRKDKASRFGPEVGISKVLNKNFPDKKFILIKYARGGSSLLDWSPEYSREKAEITQHPEFGNMYEMLFSRVDSIKEVYNSEIIAFTWMQGERDARFQEAANEYYPNFKLLIEKARERTGKKDLPVIFGQINPPHELFPFDKKVRSEQKKINTDINNTWLIETNDLGKHDDNLHYDTDGQLLLGEKFGNTISKIIEQQKH